jgi:ATP-dependent helicase/nuclease subunit A
MSTNDATRAQIAAADPTRSTWVSANAGSGKTRVLTDRVARLLLNGTPPQRILCLTYTKAAASNMQNKLFARLGEWAMLPDTALRARLAELGELVAAEDPASLMQARTLFARALETPGGLKIQTIHSFCSTILRRFPLEAGVSPQFEEMDDRVAARLRADVLDHMAGGLDTTAFDALAAFQSGEDADGTARAVAGLADKLDLSMTRADIWAAYGLPKDFARADYLDSVLTPGLDEILEELAALLEDGSSTECKTSEKILSILATPSLSRAEPLEDLFVFGQNTKNPDTPKFTTIATKPTREAHPGLFDRLAPYMQAFADAKPLRQALNAAEKSYAVNIFARIFIPAYEQRKLARGMLDFDDLIRKAGRLLSTPGVAEWVLYKMDGGIDHILVDEAQDTSPDQWQVIERIADEFFAGDSGRDVQRTLFVVGDEKQSIYSFQGADPAAFDAMRRHFDARLSDIGQDLQNAALLHSFRSSTAILGSVDKVLDRAPGANLSARLGHIAFFDALPGRVDLWPFHPKGETPEPAPWFEPVDTPPADDPSVRLAAEIAGAIDRMLAEGAPLPTGSGSRPIRAGDILILVQRRSDLFHEIIRALKARGLPVAGADRLRVGAQLAVKDLAALLAFLATPEDDLSLASVLRSPLCGLDEDALFRLAHGRKGTLWKALVEKAGSHADVVAMLDDLRRNADFLRPFDLVDRVLTRHGGRARLVARLGAEAVDGIDAFLQRTLDYEQAEVPTLTGFLGWFDDDIGDIKRELDTRSGQIRVMTAHGAKGLESPVVILPDTAVSRVAADSPLIPLGNGLVGWAGGAEDNPPILRAAVEARRAFQREERQRLLYVAMTRAESWLIVAGCGKRADKRTDENTTWYDLIEDAFADLPAEHLITPFGPGKRFSTGAWPISAEDVSPEPEGVLPGLPDWTATHAPAGPPRINALNPSNLGGAKIVGGSEDGLEAEAAKARGVHLHALLEHLPGSTDREAEARWILPGLPDDVRRDLLAEATAVLNAPDLAQVFAHDALAEVGITAQINGQKLDGVIDRLILSDDHVLAVDFKTNAVVPDRAEATPEGLLRQMGAYAAALAQVYPGRRIQTAILWTRTATLMPLPHDIVSAALDRAATS